MGMRRAGKTTFLHQIRRERLAGGAARERLPYINFEDERCRACRPTHLEPLRRGVLPALSGTAAVAAVIWCFDEIQTVPGWERFVRRLLDSARRSNCS